MNKKGKNKTVQSLAVRRAMLTEELASLKARLNFGHLPRRDMAELSQMIDLRKKALRKI
ncbi:MAG: hypothetical protein NTX59_02560 [Elusimicrobia bacterium]|nr:hypothetical protein [Elusimicrobiota bacterium]